MKKAVPGAPTVLPPPPPAVNTARRRAGRPRGSILPAAAPAEAAVITARQVATMLQLGDGTVKRLATQGAIPGRIPLTRTLRFSRAIVEDWIAAGCPPLPPKAG